jgi:hypothetical protein
MRKFRLLMEGVFALLLMATSAMAQGVTCHDPQKSMLEVDLMFGRNIGARLG